MRYLLGIILLFFYIETYSQGFDWQYSYRLPYSIPSKFIGLNGGYSLNSSTGDFEFLEDYTPCCKYQSGTGYSLEIGLHYEYWLNSISAVIFKSTFNSTSSNFSQTIQVPRSDGINDYIAKYNYSMSEKRNYLILSGLFKHRILKSHFAIVAGLNSYYILGSQATHTEDIISPMDERFIDGTRSRVIKKGMYGEYNTITINPVIGFNYDYAILRGYYSSFTASLQIPVTNVINNEDWKEWKFQVSVTILKSID